MFRARKTALHFPKYPGCNRFECFEVAFFCVEFINHHGHNNDRNDKNANLAHAVLDTKNAETSITNTAIIAVLKAIFPAKTWASLTKLVCMSDSTAKNRMLQRREFTADEIGALLWSEHGREVLIAIMTQAPVEPDWWRVAKSLFQIHDAEKFQHEARQRVRSILNEAVYADRDLSAAIARADAMLVHDAEFYGVQADAFREASSSHHRSMAAKQHK